jgi:hypothetical protein
MSDIEVSIELFRPLEQLAAEHGKSVESIVEELIVDYLREQRHQFLLQEMARFRAQHAELHGRYEGQFIAMRDGRVLDHDIDGGILYKRIREKHGEIPVLIVAVNEQPEQIFTRLSHSLDS